MQEKAAVALECAYYFFCIQNLHTKLLYARLLLFWVSCFFRKTHSLTAPLRFFRSTLLPCLRSIEPTTQNAIQFYSQFFFLNSQVFIYKCITFALALLLNITFSLPPYQTKSSRERERTSTSSTLLLPTLHLHTSIKHPHIHKYIDSPIQTQFISYITGFL